MVRSEVRFVLKHDLRTNTIPTKIFNKILSALFPLVFVLGYLILKGIKFTALTFLFLFWSSKKEKKEFLCKVVVDVIVTNPKSPINATE